MGVVDYLWYRGVGLTTIGGVVDYLWYRGVGVTTTGGRGLLMVEGCRPNYNWV